MKIKKIALNSMLGTFTIGASALLGFLSFTGMLALWPILPLAIAAFILSIAYEGEIYLQNIRSSLKKLFKKRSLPLQVSNEFLLKIFPDTTNEDCPTFFKDYEKRLKLFAKYGEKRLDKDSQTRKDDDEKYLREMEKWFCKQVFTKNKHGKKLTPYQAELQTWLNHADRQPQLEALKQRRAKLGVTFNIAKIFAGIAALFMMVGSSYLLVGAIAVIPLLATMPYVILPIIVVPIAVIAGAAYGLLIYNAVTNMIANDTVRKWFFKIREDWRAGNKARSIFIAITSVILAALAVTLTICTAGTWWTIAQNAQPIFSFMTKIPAFVMGIINPIVIGIASIIFNWQNTSETLDMIHAATNPSSDKKANIFVRIGRAIKNGFNNLRATENLWQVFNPFRIILKLTHAPLRILLFIGHLISMGVTDDRVPGIPQWLAALLGTVSETFEDAHYFFDLAGGGHDHHHHGHEHHCHDHHHGHTTKNLLQERHGEGHGHNHNNDLPTRFIKVIFIPIYFLAASWDYGFSKLNKDEKNNLSFTRSFEKQWGLTKIKNVKPNVKEPVSLNWKKEQAIFSIERFKKKHLKSAVVGKPSAQAKIAQLSNLQNQIADIDNNEQLTSVVAGEQNKETYKSHRFFPKSSPKDTETVAFLKKLDTKMRATR